jgi:hypothetical protein
MFSQLYTRSGKVVNHVTFIFASFFRVVANLSKLQTLYLNANKHKHHILISLFRWMWR